MEIAARLKEARQAIGLSQKAIAEQSGVSTRGYQGYEDGRSIPGGEALAGLASAGINPLWLLTGDGSMLINAVPVVHSAGDDGLVNIKQYVGLRASAGYGAAVEIEYDDVKLIKINEVWLRRELGLNPANAAAFLVVGDSMSPTFNDGDIGLMDVSIRHLEREGVYFLQSGGMALIKRVRAVFGGGLEIISDNPAYQTVRIGPEELKTANFTVVGRVVWGGRRF